mmetsp:Transcript_97502/g.303684  ORF Transcript_97502/g.303684 Transcript_97502/m.303684 type:complete len:202 (+) Transcript_97502:15-620(+)
MSPTPRGTLAFLAVVALGWQAGNLFVQPPKGANAGVGTGAGSAGQPRTPLSLPAFDESTEAQASSSQGLLLGLALGLVVGLAGAGFPGSAEAVPDEKEALAWAKEKAKVWNDRQFTQATDKYARTSTGAGVYHSYGIDKYYPIPSIPANDDGTYPLKDGLYPKEELPWVQKIKDEIARGDRIPSKYGNFYSKSSPFPYNPK